MRIEIAYEDWLREQAQRRGVRVSLLLEEAAARLSQRARSHAVAASYDGTLGGAAPCALVVGIPLVSKLWLEEEAERRAISIHDLLDDVAERFASRAERRAMRLAADPGRESNNPKGRPKLGPHARVPTTVTIDPGTKAILTGEAKRRGISLGLLLDDLAYRFERQS